jgi:hypothetical protein
MNLDEIQLVKVTSIDTSEGVAYEVVPHADGKTVMMPIRAYDLIQMELSGYRQALEMIMGTANEALGRQVIEQEAPLRILINRLRDAAAQQVFDYVRDAIHAAADKLVVLQSIRPDDRDDAETLREIELDLYNTIALKRPDGKDVDDAARANAREMGMSQSWKELRNRKYRALYGIPRFCG